MTNNKIQMTNKFQISNLKFKILLWLSIIFFVIFFSYIAIRRYQTLNSYYYDLGIMNQVVYNTSRGRFLEMTNQDLMKNVSRLAIHFDPILAFFSPFYLFYPGPEVLLVSQVIIVSLGAWAVFLISKRILKKDLISFIFSLSYLFYFAVQRVVLFDFHAVSLATTFFLFALYFQEIKKWRYFFVFIILALLTKEHIGLVVFMLGIYQFFLKKERKIGWLSAAVGLIFFISTVYFIIPYFRGNEHFAMKYFYNLKERYKDIIINGLSYSKMILTPVIYSIFSPLSLLISLPEWAINTFSLNNNQRSFFFHYNSVIVSFLFYSLILGYKNFNKLVKNKLIKNIVFFIFIFLNLYSIYIYNPLPYFVKNPVKYQDINPITKNSIKFWQEKLKDEKIIVSTTPKLAPFFTNRITYHNFLYDSAYSEMGLIDNDIIKTIDDYKIADYVIVYRPEIGDIDKANLPVKFYQKLREDKNYQVIFSDDLNEKSIEVYKKINL